MAAAVNILYATASGNAETLAQAAAERLAADGHGVQVANVADFPAARLREVDVALLIASTWGEGEPPPDAVDFCAALAAAPERSLAHLEIGISAAAAGGSTRTWRGAGHDGCFRASNATRNSRPRSRTGSAACNLR